MVRTELIPTLTSMPVPLHLAPCLLALNGELGMRGKAELFVHRIIVGGGELWRNSHPFSNNS